VTTTAQAGELTRFVWLVARGSTSGLVMARVWGRIELQGRSALDVPGAVGWDRVWIEMPAWHTVERAR
jgi:hypothetical protein